MADREQTVRIDGARFWSTIEKSGQIGPGATIAVLTVVVHSG